VSEIAVAGLPDPEWGQRVVAWVVPTDPATPPTLAALRALVGEHLPAFCAPKELRIVAALPRTALGKVQRHLLDGAAPPGVTRSLGPTTHDH
jgi:acyl-CoA synthetase (AMP-forming)/AMP-acid ligase II